MFSTITRISLAFAITAGAHADVIHVAAAASVQHAMEEIAARFRGRTGHEVKLVFGASGTLARQILRGGPFDLFLSADGACIAPLRERGLVRGEVVDYATGRLVLFVHSNSSVPTDARLAGLSSAARDGRLERVAIANPEHAPYGAIARQALQNAGAWEALRPQLVMGENAAQTAQFALSGAVDAALLPASYAALGAVTAAGRTIAVSETIYTPLRQRMALLTRAREPARELYDFIRGSEGGDILKRHGLAP